MRTGTDRTQLPGGPARVPWVTSALFLFVLLSHFGGMGEVFEYHAVGIEQGEYWRLLTGHFTHLTPNHLFWDGAVFLALGIVLEIRNRWSFVGCVLASALFIGLALPVLRPGLIVYRGLSGIDTALFVLLATELTITAYRERNRILSLVAPVGLAGLILKVAFEYVTGSTLFVGNGLTPVPIAHLVGALVGFTVAVLQCGPTGRVWRQIRCSLISCLTWSGTKINF